MEENEEKGLFQVRSYLKCLDEGFKLPTRHILPLLKFLWPSLAACAVVAGLWGVFVNRLSVVFAQWWAATEPVVLMSSVLTLAILLVLSLLAQSFYAGQVMHVVSRYAGEAVWPALKWSSERHAVLAVSVRALTLAVVGLVVLALLLTPFVWWLGATDVWTLVAFGVILLVLGVPYVMVTLDYVLCGEHRFVQSLARLKDGFRNWGLLFIVLFCSGLLLLLLVVVSWLPAGILAHAGHLSALTVLGGDATDLPAFVPAFIVISFMVASVAVSVFSWLMLFPLSYLYGSIEARRKELAEFEAEELRLQKA